jgi:hypothetical protein
MPLVPNGGEERIQINDRVDRIEAAALEGADFF